MIFCEIRTKNTSCSVQASAPAISKICCCWSSSYPTPPVAPTSSATTTTREALPRLTFHAVRMSGRIAGAIITRNSLIRVGRKLKTISMRSDDGEYHPGQSGNTLEQGQDRSKELIDGTRAHHQ